MLVGIKNKKTQHKVQTNIVNSGQVESEVTGEHTGEMEGRTRDM